MSATWPGSGMTGAVTVEGQAWEADAAGFPADRDIELLLESGGAFQARFLLTPLPGASLTRKQRLLAIAFAVTSRRSAGCH